MKLVALGLAPSRARAQSEIAAGNVVADGKPVTKPSQKIPDSAEVSLKSAPYPWVSRGAEKLLKALATFNLSLEGKTVLDLGASTGGFTQVALAQGAAHVWALDVGQGQLHPTLRENSHVTNLEGLHVKDLSADHLPRLVDVIVTDVSFISLKKALPPALKFASPEALLIALIKPQFEVGKENLGRGGIVKDASLHQAVCEDIRSWLAQDQGWQILGLCDSPILGGDGNKEFLIAATQKA